MAGTLILGCVMIVACVVIQCVVVSIMLRVLLVLETRTMIRPTVFLARGEFQDFATALYHSVVNFATLGYGDIVMREKSRLLGALEGVHEVLMFGLTTGVLFLVLSEQMHLAWNERIKTE